MSSLSQALKGLFLNGFFLLLGKAVFKEASGSFCCLNPLYSTFVIFHLLDHVNSRKKRAKHLYANYKFVILSGLLTNELISEIMFLISSKLGFLNWLL